VKIKNRINGSVGYNSLKLVSGYLLINSGGLEMLETLIDRVKEEGKEEGKVEGKYEKSINIAKNLLKMNIPIEQVAQATELPIEEIQKLITES
jgi:hypothetical protein